MLAFSGDFATASRPLMHRLMRDQAGMAGTARDAQWPIRCRAYKPGDQ